MRTVAFVRSNALGLVAIFIALGGTAVATQVNRTTKVVQAEPAKKPKGKPGPRGPQGPAGPQGLQGPSGLQGQSGLAGTIGRQSPSGGCNDDDQNSDDCATVSITLPQAGRMLLVANANWRTTSFDDIVPPNDSGDQVTVANGFCVLTADGGTVSDSLVNVGEVQGGATDESWTDGGLASMGTTAVTNSLAAGPHTFTLQCTESDGDLDWSNARVSAVSLGSG
jgi:hypothetical protein